MQYVFEQKVLFRHCDPAGIVFFPRYFEMVNDCIEHFFDEVLLWPFEKLLETDGIPTAEIRMRFRAPSRHGDRLRLTLDILRFGRSAMDYRLIASCGGQVRFEAEATLVHVDRAGRPAPWPDAVRDRTSPTTEERA